MRREEEACSPGLEASGTGSGAPGEGADTGSEMFGSTGVAGLPSTGESGCGGGTEADAKGELSSPCDAERSLCSLSDGMEPALLVLATPSPSSSERFARDDGASEVEVERLRWIVGRGGGGARTPLVEASDPPLELADPNAASPSPPDAVARRGAASVCGLGDTAGESVTDFDVPPSCSNRARRLEKLAASSESLI